MKHACELRCSNVMPSQRVRTAGTGAETERAGTEIERGVVMEDRPGPPAEAGANTMIVVEIAGMSRRPGIAPMVAKFVQAIQGAEQAVGNIMGSRSGQGSESSAGKRRSGRSEN